MTDERVGMLLALLKDHSPIDERAAESRRRMLEEIPTLPSPFEESSQPTHVTASAVVLSSAGVLLHRHKRLGIWVGPGGHIDPAEAPEEAARREAMEETGINTVHPAGGPELIHVDVHPGPKGHTHLDLRWLLLAEPDEPRPAEGESGDVRWVSFPQAAGMVPDDYGSALRAAVAASEHSGSR